MCNCNIHMHVAEYFEMFIEKSIKFFFDFMKKRAMY